MKKISTKTMAYMALYVALYIVLKYVGNFIPFFVMPNGGSIEIELVAVFIATYQLGFGLGCATAILSMLVSWIFWQPWYLNPLQLILDYIGPIAVCGLASLLWPFKKLDKVSGIVAALILAIATFLGIYYCFNQTIWAIVAAIVVAIVMFIFMYKFEGTVGYYGIVIAMILKGLQHVISGAYYWAEGMAAGSLEAWAFSVTYNLWYNLVTLVVCIIVVPLLVERLKKAGIQFKE